MLDTIGVTNGEIGFDRASGDIGGKALENMGQQATGPVEPGVSPICPGKYWRMRESHAALAVSLATFIIRMTD